MANYYEILGVSPQATANEIDQAYRFLAQKFHPDANPDNVEVARKRFQVAQEAFEVLSDRGRRRQYDEKLAAGMGAGWESITMNTDNGGVRFNADGSVDVAGRHLNPADALPQTSIGAASIEKDAGPQGEFRVRHKGQLHCFRFSNGQWYAKKDKPNVAKQAPPRPPNSDVNNQGLNPIPPMDATSRPHSNRYPIAGAAANNNLRNTVIGATLLTIGILGGFIASYSGAFKMPLSEEEQIAQKEELLRKRAQLKELDDELEQQAAMAVLSQQEIALQREALLEAKRLGDSALESAEELLREAKLWQEKIPPLLSSDEGMRLAASDVHVRAFTVLYGKTHASVDEATSLRQQVVSLRDPIEQALTNNTQGFRVQGGLNERFQALKVQVEEEARSLREDRLAIGNLVTLSSAASSGNPRTLQAAIDAMALAETEQKMQLIAEREQETREKSNAEMARARQDLLAVKAEEERQRVEQESRALQEKVLHEKNLAEAKSEDVQNALRFFITPGYYQPGGTQIYSRTLEPRPISLSKLQAKGALDPTERGIEQLLTVVTQFPSDDRTNWGIPKYMHAINTGHLKQLSTAQDYLRRLGPALVELKLLDP
jgi:curved DNA-binding protein CbpA